MNKRTEKDTDHMIAVDIETLKSMCCVGTTTAKQIAKESGAKIKIGTRTIYNVKKIQEYLDSISGIEQEDRDGDI